MVFCKSNSNVIILDSFLLSAETRVKRAIKSKWLQLSTRDLKGENWNKTVHLPRMHTRVPVYCGKTPRLCSVMGVIKSFKKAFWGPSKSKKEKSPTHEVFVSQSQWDVSAESWEKEDESCCLEFCMIWVLDGQGTMVVAAFRTCMCILAWF